MYIKVFQNLKYLQYFLRHSSTCINSQICTPNCSPVIVTLTGATSKVGQLTALLLKQCSLINELRMFDFPKGLDGIALDLSHIDTFSKVVPYTGLDKLRNAITEASIIVICGGEAPKIMDDYDLFVENADYVRCVALHAAEFNPNAIICIATPPIAAMVPLVSEEFKKSKVYDPKKIIGITTLGVIRANSVIANYVQKDPQSIMCPIVGGMSNLNVVPVLSQTEPGPNLPQPAIDLLHNQIGRAENEALALKFVENSGPCVLSPAYATARFVMSVILGLSDKAFGYECAFIRQTGHIEPFLMYMTTLIKLSTHGVHSIYMPYLNDFESTKLKEAAENVRMQIKWGECYITGEPLQKKRRTKRPSYECDVIKINDESRIGEKWM